jgi:uncharacterized protein (TIGR02996 family)
MDTHEAGFLHALREDPEDRPTWAAYTDWLRERDDPRVELAELLAELTRSVEVPDRRNKETRLRALLRARVRPLGPFVTNSLGMTFAWVRAGVFTMGSPQAQASPFDDEVPHAVRLTRGFFLGVAPVLQRQWEAVLADNPSLHRGPDLPAEHLPWAACQEFCRRLGEREGLPYRLPTEAEWEYACRAGTTTRYWFGNRLGVKLANCGAGEGRPGTTTGPGRYPANPFGLYDVHGNVWEWCADWYDVFDGRELTDPTGPEEAEEGDTRVVKGGAWDSTATYSRSAFRCNGPPACHNHDWVGLRVCYHPGVEQSS